MSKIKGQNFRFFADIDGGGLAAVPEETNVSVSLTGNTEDTTTKDTEGMFSQEDIMSTAWSAQVDSYQAEIDVLMDYMPKQLSAEEILDVVKATAAEIGVEAGSGKAGMGKLMGGVMPKVKGVADGNQVKKIVMEFLG
jgi:Glu-tRNA(Gln) amidotransferase subunit E-like FAD-binding protein